MKSVPCRKCSMSGVSGKKEEDSLISNNFQVTKADVSIFDKLNKNRLISPSAPRNDDKNTYLNITKRGINSITTLQQKKKESPTTSEESLSPSLSVTSYDEEKKRNTNNEDEENQDVSNLFPLILNDTKNISKIIKNVSFNDKEISKTKNNNLNILAVCVEEDSLKINISETKPWSGISKRKFIPFY